MVFRFARFIATNDFFKSVLYECKFLQCSIVKSVLPIPLFIFRSRTVMTSSTYTRSTTTPIWTSPRLSGREWWSWGTGSSPTNTAKPRLEVSAEEFWPMRLQLIFSRQLRQRGRRRYGWEVEVCLEEKAPQFDFISHFFHVFWPSSWIGPKTRDGRRIHITFQIMFLNLFFINISESKSWWTCLHTLSVCYQVIYEAVYGGIHCRLICWLLSLLKASVF